MTSLNRFWKINSLRSNILVPVILALLLLLGSMMLILQQSQQKMLKRELSATTKAAESLFLEYGKTEAKMMSLALSTLSLNRELLTAFKAKDRERLHELTKCYFVRLRSHYDVTHLYFTGTDRVNILRLHKPDRFGDRIDRVTTLEAEKTGEEAQGVELGPLGTFTLRVVKPWYDGERLLGFVELGMEIEHILKELQRILGSRVCAFIHKDFIQREGWEAGIRMLGRKEEWGHFPDTVIIGEPLGQISEKVAQVIAGKHPLQPVTEIHTDGRYYRVAFIPLIDAAKRDIGHLAILLDTTARISAFRRSVLLISLFYVVVGAALCLFFYAFIGWIEKEQKRREETRLEFEQRFKIIFDGANDGIMLVDVETKKLSLGNKMICSMLGYGPEEINTLGVVDIHPEKDLPRILDGFERIQRMEIEMGENLPVKRKDGSIFYADISASSLTLGGKSFHVAIFRDITERRKAEERIRESEARFNQVAESVGEWIWEVDTDGLYIYSSPAVERILGYRVDEIVGRMHFYDFFLPEEREDLKNAAFEVFAGKEPFRGFVNSNLHKNGTRVIVETSGVPSRDQQGRFVGYCGTDTDITERMKADERIRESEARYRSIFEYADDIIYLLNPDGTFRSLNPAFEKITGWTAEEWIGKSFAPTIHPDDLSSLMDILEKTMTGESLSSFSLRLARKSGEYFESDICVAPINNNGEIGIVGIARDVSERKRAEGEIRKLNEELETRVKERTKQLEDAQEELLRKKKLAILGQLSGSVGHELRNPLGVMSNAVYFLKMVLAEADETVAEYLDIIKKEIDNSLQIITDLLDFARTKPPQLKAVNARALIDESLGRCTLPENVDLQNVVPKTLPPLKVDPAQMGQVLQNLITNGIQAMPAGGTLTLRGEQDSEETVRLEVVDTGEGVSPENMRKLFQPLFTTKAKGIGLGLVVCRNLTEANDGRIEVASEPGQGTTFAVVLPIERRTV